MFPGVNCVAESWTQGPGQIRYLQLAGLGRKPTTTPRLFPRPCNSGYTSVPSHMEMRYLCSYASASESGPSGCPSGCGPQSEVLELHTVLLKMFLLLLKPVLLFGLLLICSVPSPQRGSSELASFLPWLTSLGSGLFTYTFYCHHIPNCYPLFELEVPLFSLDRNCHLGR